jgi:ferredoxin-NADP reductase/pSer/pThr/pTyr-binding forkhead associated (FHA) protein/ferredoxin
VKDKVRVVKQGVVLHEFPLGQDTLTVGRHKDVDIQLEDIQLSRFHAEITRSGRDYFLTDRKSLNGTLLNGTKLKPERPMVLRDGAVASIAPFELQFEIEETERTVVPAPVPVPTSSQLFDQPPEAGLLLTHMVEQREKIPIWTKGKMVLQIADIIEETHDVKTFRMVGEKPILFSYLPGQFMTLRLEIDGKPVKRSYTISSSPSRPHTVEITVKRVRGGQVSNWLCDNVKLGDRIDVQGPAGKFSCFNYPSQKIFCIGAGSGITPVMSMCRWIVDTAADVDVTLLACYRSPMDIIFRRELEVMASRHSTFRVSIAVGTGAGPEPWTGLTGQVDKGILKLVCPDILDRHIFMCGPPGFMDCVKDHLKELDYPIANLHTESFGSGRVAKNTKVEPRDVPKREASVIYPSAATPPPRPVTASAAPAAPPNQAPPAESAQPVKDFKVHFAASGKEVLTDGASDLLKLAEVNGIEIDYSCRSGSCLTCRVMCKSGKVEMEEGDLDTDERAEGWILPCVAYACSDLVVEA